MYYPTQQLSCPYCKHTNFSGTMCPNCGRNLVEQETIGSTAPYSVKRASIMRRTIGHIYQYCPHCDKKL